ncbi:hypothetical protein, partial [Mesorhizobium sp. M0208]|uniref:hypothetical protein n=1 Tax=Mesorhizobium sp. M0208 TaxID=2956916 RepID=UPI00333B35A3
MALSTSLFLEIPRAPAARSLRTRNETNVDFLQFLALSTSLFWKSPRARSAKPEDAQRNECGFPSVLGLVDQL